jgi:Ca2+-binding EF-hand superfamily protein
MSVSTVGSSNAYAYLQRPSQPDGVDGSDAGPTDALQSLYQAFTGGNANDPLAAALGSDGGSSNAGGCGMPQFSTAAMSALLSVQSGQDNPAADRVRDLIAKFDTDGDGQVSQSEFENAIGSDADKSKIDALFAKLDGNGDGSISQDELQTALQKAHGGGHHHQHYVADSSGSGQPGGDPLQALISGALADGSTSQTSSHADGSTTTTITYSDGTKLEMTTPAASSDDNSSGGSNTASGNPNAFNLGSLLKLMVSLQAQLAPPTADVSA